MHSFRGRKFSAHVRVLGGAGAKLNKEDMMTRETYTLLEDYKIGRAHV